MFNQRKVTLVGMVMFFCAFGIFFAACATTSRIESLEEKSQKAMDTANQALEASESAKMDVKVSERYSSEAAAHTKKAEAAAGRSEQAANRAESAARAAQASAERAEAAARKTQALYDKIMAK